MPSWERLDTFFATSDFGVSFVVRYQSGAIKIAAGLYDEHYYDASLGEYVADMVKPRITCKWGDVLDVLRGDVVEIAGKRYDVLTAAQPDGTGIATLELALQEVAS